MPLQVKICACVMCVYMIYLAPRRLLIPSKQVKNHAKLQSGVTKINVKVKKHWSEADW